jgi:hypothetical protein
MYVLYGVQTVLTHHFLGNCHRAVQPFTYIQAYHNTRMVLGHGQTYACVSHGPTPYPCMTKAVCSLWRQQVHSEKWGGGGRRKALKAHGHAGTNAVFLCSPWPRNIPRKRNRCTLGHTLSCISAPENGRRSQGMQLPSRHCLHLVADPIRKDTNV